MPRLSPRDRVAREIRSLAEASDRIDPNLKRFLECPKLQRASAALGAAAAALSRGRQHSAFTAATFTPLHAPPGWLPPII